jgi:hypothetical protein
MAIGTRVTSVVSAAALMVVGCDEARSDACGDEAEVSARELIQNGMFLNGMFLNGMFLNGMFLNGMFLNGQQLNRLEAADGSGDYIETLGVDLHKGGAVESTWLAGSALTVKTNKGETLTGESLAKAKLDFDVQEGGPTKKKLKGVKIRGVKRLAPGSDVWLYDLDVKLGGGGWQPLCVDHNGEPTEAILLGDVWNPTTAERVSPRPAGALTFACRDAALAKCVEYGYRPWAGTSLAEHHQACTRMVRADYCGDGVSHTSNGTPVHVLDAIGVQKVDANVNFAVEAEWGPNGAVCLNSNNMRVGGQSLSCQLPACGAPFASGGLIQSGKVVGP